MLCVFRMRYIDFRRAEVEALVKLATGMNVVQPKDKVKEEDKEEEEGGECFAWEFPQGGTESMDAPFWYLRAPTRAAAEALARVVGERGVLVKALVDLWGEGASFGELLESLKEDNALKAGVEDRKSRIGCFSRREATFKFNCEGFGRKIGQTEQLKLIDGLADVLGHVGKVDLKNPECEFYVGNACCAIENNLPYMPDWWYFGEYLCKTTTFYEEYKLSDRLYLGPTSMDHEVAAIMANMAQVERGSVAFDPYVGTGSILIACSHVGAMTVGGDIDIRVIVWGKDKVLACDDEEEEGGANKNKNKRKGKGWGNDNQPAFAPHQKGGGKDADSKVKRVDVWSNFDSYGLERPLALVRCDAHALPFRTDCVEVFDAVVCDPPYGIRAGGRKSGGRKGLHLREVPEQFKDEHIPSTAVYPMSECLADLLDLSAKLLRLGGRLVYFFPSSNGIVFENFLPAHPCLRVEHCSEQGLTHLWGRKLVTMVKHKSWDEAEAREYKANLLRAGSDFLKLDNLQEAVFRLLDEGDAEEKARLQTLQEKHAKRSYKGKKV
ncbi:tRNA guanosine-2'-O-methyltransferase [Chloropicon primus]|uniref:tRNA (guanine(10)-N(2))-methyltransferase n=1 Tax=Chloropicon primus TaxID=1764295 RepID=A0A5B8MJ92_9CHLO|nr:tRNA guanosine-2'-O-methyltransferase [Chloropicon primus]UPQ98670.1 tRNA guanosine-2'-O-methyltransferase [Chloropicon primus]|eukprot:QDZ19460.1 tRNA guanosine-2'-O-methyltransferase [Chloropicon primus]